MIACIGASMSHWIKFAARSGNMRGVILIIFAQTIVFVSMRSAVNMGLWQCCKVETILKQDILQWTWLHTTAYNTLGNTALLERFTCKPTRTSRSRWSSQGRTDQKSKTKSVADLRWQSREARVTRDNSEGHIMFPFRSKHEPWWDVPLDFRLGRNWAEELTKRSRTSFVSRKQIFAWMEMHR